MENDFLKYICSLAPEGETALIVKQIDTGKLHLDGTIKYTWPAYMPTHKRKKGEAWFVNTGSFIIDRFKNGKPSASTANCDHVLFMMLDDIGTKSKTPPLEPTWIIETSPGNFQWGYVYSEQPTTGEHCAAITAIARAGYSDPGATNAVRNCRLPGSTNQKPGRDSFEARLVEFTRKEYTIAEICAALDVVPDEASTAKTISFNIKDTGTDSVLTWLNDKGLVLSGINAEGWLSIVCPNNHEHTDGQIFARYKPLDRSFCCYHGHCEHLKSADFLKWVCDNGGPQAEHGLRDDVLVAEMRAMREKLPENKMFADDAEKRIVEVDTRQAGRVEREKWFKRFAYITSDDAFFDMVTRNEMQRNVFNAVFRHIECTSLHGKGARRIEAATWFDEHRTAKGGVLLKGLTYAAGEEPLVYNSNGDVYGNRWVDARPTYGSGDITPWLDHCTALVPDIDEREHVFNVMAYKVQHPEIKINHAVLHGGDEGCGKDTLWAPFIWAVCGPDLRNRGLIDSDNLQSQWGYALESEVLILNELREPEAKERRALANKLKPIIAAPPETLTVNRKGLHPYDMVNRLFVLAFTNDPVPLSLPTQDRRWFCIWSRAPRMAPKQALAMWDWYKSGGFEAIAGWLKRRNVKSFNPAATPLETEFKRAMISSGMSTAESYILDEIESRHYPFNKGVIGGPWFKICNQLANAAPPGVKVPQPALLHALKEAGWKDLGLVHAPEHPTKRHIFVSPEMAQFKKSELRRMVEDDKTSDNVINLRS